MTYRSRKKGIPFCFPFDVCLISFTNLVICADNPGDTTVLLCVNVKQSDVWWFQTCVSLYVLVTTFKMPEDFGSVLDKQVIGPTTENLIKSDFPVQSFKPKVQIAFQRLPGQCPRKLEVER